MKRRRVVKGGIANVHQNSLKSMKCKNYAKCGKEEMVDAACVEVVCSKCTSSMVGIDAKLLAPQKKVVKKKDGFPRGYHLYKKFVHADGRVFEHGKENPKLKGTLPPTEVKVNTLTKGQRRRLREEKQLKREARLAKKYAKKMKKKEREENE